MVRKWVAVFLILAVSIGMYRILKKEPVPERKEERRMVAVVRAKTDTLKSHLSLSADFRPFLEADIHAKVSGYLEFLTVDIGDRVKKDQVIARIEMDELKADLARTTAAYYVAKLNYDRIKAVIERQPGLLAQEEVDNAKGAYEVAKANMERARVLLDYATITVPFDGVVTKRYVDPGAMISVNSNVNTLPIVHISQMKVLRLDFPVPESAVPNVHVDTPVEVNVVATGKTISGKVARTAGKIDPATHTMLTEVDVPNDDYRITAGMFAKVNIIMEQKQNVLVLPPQAVQSGRTDATVWLVNQRGELEERRVTVGLQTPDKAEILSGINAGDMVLYGSRASLAPGMRVGVRLLETDKER